MTNVSVRAHEGRSRFELMAGLAGLAGLATRGRSDCQRKRVLHVGAKAARARDACPGKSLLITRKRHDARTRLTIRHSVGRGRVSVIRLAAHVLHVLSRHRRHDQVRMRLSQTGSADSAHSPKVFWDQSLRKYCTQALGA